MWTNQELRRNWKALAARFVLVVLLLSAVALAVIAALDYQRFVGQRATLQAQEQIRLEAVATGVRTSLIDQIASLRGLASSELLREYLRNPTPASRDALLRDLHNLVSATRELHQIRLAGLDGVAQIQVADLEPSREASAATPLAPDLLRAAQQLGPGQIYLSDLDLEAPGEAPGEPILHMAIKLYDPAGRPFALLVVDNRARPILDQIASYMSLSWGAPMLLSPGGRWFAWSDEDGWRVHGQDEFTRRHPTVWRAASQRSTGAVLTDAGYFTFATIGSRRFSNAYGGNALPGQPWTLISQVPPQAYSYSLFSVLALSPGLTLGLGGLIAFLAALIAVLWTLVRSYTQALHASEQRLDLALKEAHVGLWDWDLVEDRIYFSPEWLALLGYQPGDLVGSAEELRGLIHHEDREAALGARRLGPASPCGGRYRLRHRQGHYLWLEHRGRLLLDAARRPCRLICTAIDVTEQVRAEAELRRAAEGFQGGNEAVLVMDGGFRTEAVNPAFTALTGYSADAMLGRPPRELKSLSHDPDFFRAIRHSVEQEGSWRGEARVSCQDGGERPVWVNIRAVREADGDISHYVLVMTDIAPLKQSEERLAHLAHHDPLTGLPNRRLLIESLDNALVRADRHDQRLALLFLDLDRFKTLNDTLGHAAGDKLLATVAERLRQSVRAEDLVARLGGDEFTVLLEDVKQPEDVLQPVHKIIDAVAQPVNVGRERITTSTSVGISLYPDDASTAAALMEAADAAMYQAKREGRNRYQFFTQGLASQALEHQRLEQELRRALQEQALCLLYQPQVSLTSGRVVGAEALLRWRHPRFGLIRPDRFLAVAEETGLIEPIGAWVLDTALVAGRAWQRPDRPLRLAINLSPRQLRSEPFRRRLQALLEPAQAPPPLDLEISEGVVQTAAEHLEQVAALKCLGARLVVDDFGSGLASLGALRQLPLDMLKIDGPYAVEQPAGAGLAELAVALAHTMKLTILAEGVESAAQLAFLRRIGCDEAQGNLFSPPLDAAEFGALIERDEDLVARASAA